MYCSKAMSSRSSSKCPSATTMPVSSFKDLDLPNIPQGKQRCQSIRLRFFGGKWWVKVWKKATPRSLEGNQNDVFGEDWVRARKTLRYVIPTHSFKRNMVNKTKSLWHWTMPLSSFTASPLFLCYPLTLPPSIQVAQHQTRNHASFGAMVTWVFMAGQGSRRFPQT